jgi:transcriptional regulator EpsA
LPSRLDLAHLIGSTAESLLLNLDASLHVHRRGQLFGWTQGLLQGLIPHVALVSALRVGEPMSFRVDAFSTSVPDASVLGDLLLRDAATLPDLIAAWKQRAFRPSVRTIDELAGSFGAGPLTQELNRFGAGSLLAHGSHDVGGEVSSLFLFIREARSFTEREIYLAELVAPFLQAAVVRSQTKLDEIAVDELREAPVGAAVLTDREREILHWVYLGKSNAEIGSILEISPLTVKNHVQKILRKLDVVNRAQAVGKALNARIIRP